MSTILTDALNDLEAVLRRENDALRQSQFFELGPLKEEKLTVMSRLDRLQGNLSVEGALKAELENRMIIVRDLVRRNSGLLQAALYGARSARDRLSGVTEQEQQVGAYDQSGRPVSLSNSVRLKKYKV